MGKINRHNSPSIFRAVIIILAILLISIVSGIMLTYNLEQSKREQARFNLKNIEYCINLSQDYVVDFRTRADMCAGRSKTTFTGDVYILDYADLKFVFETSKDVPRDLYFTEDSVGKYFKDWDSATNALTKMTSGYNSMHNTNVFYNFDGDIEWIEWITYRDDITDMTYIIVQGTQEDETMDRFSYLRKFVFISIMLLCVGILASAFKREENDRLSSSSRK